MIIGLDVGSSAAKAVAVGADGSVAAAARVPYPLVPGARERQDPEEVLGRVLASLTTTVAKVGAAAVDAIVLSAAMHSLLVTDADGTPLGPVRTWADTSASPADHPGLFAELDRLYAITGCPPWPVYAPARLHLAGPAPDGDWRVCTLKEWVFRRLTGRCWIDMLTASTTGLLDIHRGRWSPAALAVAGIEADQLPALVAPTATAGLLAATARPSGLPAGLPVAVGAADGPLVNLALGADSPGEASVSVGTTAAVRVVSRAPRFDPQRRLWCYRFHPGGYLLGSALNNGGLLLDWTRRLLYAEAPAGDGFRRLFDEASAIGPGADGVRMRPHLVAERDPAATGAPAGAFDGLREGHGRGALARAAVDALALSLTDIVDRLEAAGVVLTDVSVTGLPAEYPLLGRTVCDCLGRPVRLVPLPDASAVGAALLGHEAVNLPSPRRGFGGYSLAPEPVAVERYARLRCEQGIAAAAGGAGP